MSHLLNDGVNTYAYDSANRLNSLSNQSTVSSYQYNGLGDRLTQTVNGQQTNYTLDLNPSTSLRAGSGLTQVLNDGTNSYLYGVGRIAQVNVTTEYFLGDALGSVRQLTDTQGAVTLAKSYQPYGEPLSSAGNGTSPFAFTGEQTDVSGLTYLRARYYSSGAGRFLTRDTWMGDENNPMSYNLWNYTQSNPINYTDPSGLFSCNQVPREDRGECEIFRSDFAKLGITLNGDWSSVDLIAIRQAVSLVGQKFLTTPAGRNAGNSPLTAFKRVYGLNSQETLYLKWNINCPMCRPAYCREDGNVNKKDYSVDDPTILIPLFDGTKVTCDCKPKGGYTHSEHSIEFASLWPNFTQNGTYWQSVRKTNNIIHELGHAFNQRAGQSPEKLVAGYSENFTVNGKTELLKMNSRPNGFYTIGPGTMTWVQSPQVNGSEIFADMFIGWVYNKWAFDPYGDARAKFMNKGMPGWIASAVGKP